ncbi:MAG: sulfatase [bacterium]
MKTSKIILATAGLLFAMLSAGAADAPAKKPNILFIFSDDHAWQAVSAYNDPRKLIETPNIDRLGKEGVRFDRCLVPNAICGPSRATVLTGKYNHLNGVLNNSNFTFDGAQQTFPKLLKAAGYQTAIVGKWHLESDPTGFDFWQILPGQGNYYNPPMIKNGQGIKFNGYVTDIITDASLDWLKSRDKSKPFLLMCQHKAPHREWQPALSDLNFDHDKKYAEPETLFDDYAGRGLAEKDQDMTIEKSMSLNRDCKLVAPGGLTPEQKKIWDAYYEPRNDEFRKANLTGKDLVRWKYNRYMHDYLGCIKAVDDSVGKVLKYLDDEGLADNTIVVYSSDQGFFLGEHGWFDKRWIFEESARAPLLVRWPGVAKAGTVKKEIVSNLDFAETFLDVAGVAVPPDMQGRSFIPLLKGDAPADWRKSFYYQYYEYPEPHHVRPHYGVISGDYTLVHFYAPDVNYWELFDLQKDPHQIRSVYGQPDYASIQADLSKELKRLRTEMKVPDHFPLSAYGRSKLPESAMRPFDND